MGFFLAALPALIVLCAYAVISDDNIRREEMAHGLYWDGEKHVKIGGPR